ncbi:hypothetical protein EDB84DRAFT_706178 [Lactarius hengduanensis]|nr:hypothetical protein EDB84DRAFT_706178 [Lactarius hengduanensis]
MKGVPFSVLLRPTPRYRAFHVLPIFSALMAPVAATIPFGSMRTRHRASSCPSPQTARTNRRAFKIFMHAVVSAQYYFWNRLDRPMRWVVELCSKDTLSYTGRTCALILREFHGVSLRRVITHIFGRCRSFRAVGAMHAQMGCYALFMVPPYGEFPLQFLLRTALTYGRLSRCLFGPLGRLFRLFEALRITVPECLYRLRGITSPSVSEGSPSYQ